MSSNKTLFWGALKIKDEIKDENAQANFMFKVRDNSALKRILGACWGACAITRHSSLSLYLCSFSRKPWDVKLVLCLQISTKIFYKMIVSLWVCISMHPQSTWDNKFTISLQYLKKNVKDELDFCVLIIVKGFSKVILSF